MVFVVGVVLRVGVVGKVELGGVEARLTSRKPFLKRRDMVLRYLMRPVPSARLPAVCIGQQPYARSPR